MAIMENLSDVSGDVGQHVLNIGSMALSLAIIALAVNFVYNIYFGPLSSYPGPKLWAGTRLFAFRHALRGDLIYKIQEFHERYGPVVRTAPTELSFISSSAWKEIYGHRNVEMPKVADGRGGILPAPNGVHTILTAPRADHSRMRRNVAHAFSEKALRDQESYIQMYVNQLIQGIRNASSSGEPQNMLNWYNFTTFDVIGDLAFGEPFGCLRETQYHSWITSIFKGIQSNPWIQFGMYYRISHKILKYFLPKGLVEARLQNYRTSAEKMDRRMELTEDRKDFTSYMLKHSDEKGLSTQELRTMATTLIIAGSETTATLLTGTTYYILKHPKIYDRLAKEIRERFTSEEDITFTSVNELKYMLAVLEEGLRMYPPVPTLLPRVVPSGGEVIGGKWVPENTAVGVPQFAAYHSETNFHRAKEFLPERWLAEEDGGSQEFAKDDKVAFQPFSFGPRNCIGRNLAYAEMRVIVAKLLFNFEMELQNTPPGWEHQMAPLLWSKKPLMVKLTDRKSE